MAFESNAKAKAYWRENIRLMLSLLAVWFTVSYGCGILLVDWLNQFTLGGFKLGFWFSQQGSIYVFVALIFVYVVKMNQLDRKYIDSPPIPRTMSRTWWRVFASRKGRGRPRRTEFSNFGGPIYSPR